jgi:hypothetical protein
LGAAEKGRESGISWTSGICTAEYQAPPSGQTIHREESLVLQTQQKEDQMGNCDPTERRQRLDKKEPDREIRDRAHRPLFSAFPK